MSVRYKKKTEKKEKTEIGQGTDFFFARRRE